MINSILRWIEDKLARFNELGNNRADKQQSNRSADQEETEWLDLHYPIKTLTDIEAIQENAPLQGDIGNGQPGGLWRYLRKKSREFEEQGEIDLSIACMKKSISFMRLRYGENYGRKESMSLVYLLLRHGRNEEAEAERKNIEAHYIQSAAKARRNAYARACQMAKELDTDFLQIQVLGSTCQECAVYQGRVFSISGRSKVFPPMPEHIKDIGAIHPGCHHVFFPYIHGATVIDMDRITSVHPLVNPKYGKDIITFSNRPFVDDRTEECKRISEENRKKREEKKRLERLSEQKAIKRKQ